jgi:hypothetical protein
METTIKVSKETKERILSLDLAEKGKTFDMIVNDLISYYKHTKKDYSKNLKKWKKSFDDHEEFMVKYGEDYQSYEKSKETLEKLFSWAKTKGFKP